MMLRVSKIFLIFFIVSASCVGVGAVASWTLLTESQRACTCRSGQRDQLPDLALVNLIMHCQDQLKQNQCAEFAKTLPEKSQKEDLETCSEVSLCASPGQSLKDFIKGCNAGYWSFGEDAADYLYEALQSPCNDSLNKKYLIYEDYRRQVSIALPDGLEQTIEGLAQKPLPAETLNRLNCGEIKKLIANSYERRVNGLNAKLFDYSEMHPNQPLPVPLAQFKKWRELQKVPDPVAQLREWFDQEWRNGRKLGEIIKNKYACYNGRAQVEITCYGAMLTAATILALPGRYYLEFRLLKWLQTSERVRQFVTSPGEELAIRKYIADLAIKTVKNILGRELTAIEIKAISTARDLTAPGALVVFSIVEQQKIKKIFSESPNFN